MPRIQKTQIVLALAAAFSVQMSYADDALTPVAVPRPVPGEAHITADKLSGEMNNTLKARGDVVVTRDDQTLVSDWLDYYQAKNSVKAGDRFTLTRQKDRISGTTLDYDLENRTGTGMKPDFITRQQGSKQKSQQQQAIELRGNGSKVEFRGKDKYRVYDSSATTCSVGDDSWYLRSSRLDLDYTTGVGTSYDTNIVFKGVPVLYSPWLDFSLDGKRKSGFLYPTLKGGSSGTEIAVPYYWNIAPEYDATLTPHVNLRHGLILGAEFRYLGSSYNGWLYTEQIAKDEATKQYRYLWSGQFSQTIAPGLSYGYDGSTVSDNSYFSDFGDRYSVASNTNLVREAWANYDISWASGNANVHLLEQRYQTLESTTNSVTKPYARLPQLTFSANQSLPAGFSANLQSELTQFAHPTEQEGTRLVIYPSISLPLKSSWGFFTPKLGVHYTEYQLDPYNGANSRDISRTLPIFSIDSGLYFDRQTSYFGGSQTQTLEPRMYYLNIPTQDQSRIPNFDTTQNDYGFAQIFSENLFSGSDRISGANQLTSALTTRLMDNDDGREMMRAAIAQRFYFKDSYNNLDGSVATRSSGSSDLLASLGGEVVKHWNLDSLYQLNSQNHQTQQYYVSLNYVPAAGKILSMRYRFDRDATENADQQTENLHLLDFGTQWPIARQWYGLARFQYSLQDRQVMEQLLGVEYNAGCWILRLVGDRYVTNYTQTKTAFYVQLELKGLGSMGQDPSSVLHLAVPGYTKTNNLEQ
jgi:LPS-assembly protein